MKTCKFCGEKRVSNLGTVFRCGTLLAGDNAIQSLTCVAKERDLLRERIKRLEEVGDSIDWVVLSGNQKEMWRKAKEAKP